MSCGEALAESVPLLHQLIACTGSNEVVVISTK
jgi:hypothetical protein